jgi:MoaA/NifB/PqqE/SkfB family radical SAM enzyme
MKIKDILLTKIGIKVISSLTDIPFVRKLGMNFIDRIAHDRLLAEREECIPKKMISDKYQIFHNMAKCLSRWVSDKHVSQATHKKFLKSFSLLLTKKKSVAQEFEGTHGFKSPAFLTISPTKRCNLKCTGCYASSSADSGFSLDFEVVNRIIQEQKDLWESHFTVISGGEPFMYASHGKGILDLARNHQDTFFLVYTNGTLINSETAQSLAELGNITPAISVEGFEKETDERRGKGVHRKILGAFDNLREAGVLYGISITATRNNAETILSAEFIDYYMKQYGAYYAWIFQYMPIGRSYSLNMMVTPEQRLEMLKQTNRWMYDEDLFIADFWNSAPISSGCISAGKGSGGGYIYIDWNGNVMPCVFNPYTSHNILTVYKSGGNLNDVLVSPLMKKIRQWQKDYFIDCSTGHLGNLLAPCPIRDHHKQMRDIIDETHAHPADESAEIALQDSGYYRGMCQYGDKVNDLTGSFWENEYLDLKNNNEKAPKVIRKEKLRI